MRKDNKKGSAAVVRMLNEKVQDIGLVVKRFDDGIHIQRTTSTVDLAFALSNTEAVAWVQGYIANRCFCDLKCSHCHNAMVGPETYAEGNAKWRKAQAKL